MADDELMGFGLDPKQGGYLKMDWKLAELGQRLLDGDPAPEPAMDPGEPALDPVDGTDLKSLASSGWGVVYGAEVGNEVREALDPLLRWRRELAGSAFRELRCLPGETVEDFLNRNGAPADGPVVPEAMPYYLMLVAGPRDIRFSFQYDLDVEYGVGRIAFDTPAEYRRYAESVVAAEKKEAVPLRTTFFAPSHPGDSGTTATLGKLVQPLHEALEPHFPACGFYQVSGTEASKAGFAGLLADGSNSLIFAAGHGCALPNGDPRQRLDQGAMVCQEWPGPLHWQQRLTGDQYFSADDVPADANLLGSIIFQFACFSAGTPSYDNFRTISKEYLSVGEAFLARLPQRLLAPAGGRGALAFVGHVDRLFTHSFQRQRPTLFDSAVYREVLGRLLRGFPIGHAMQPINRRYALLAARQAQEHDRLRGQKDVDLEKFAYRWLLLNDARNFCLIGDPGTRILANS